MKLYVNTISDLLMNSLITLMQIKELNTFRLVGGTSLSLQLGHRESMDIDLFTDAEYGSIDFENIEDILTGAFPYFESLYKGDVGMGKSYFIGNSKDDLVKLDMFYTDKFILPALLYDSIRLSGLEEVAAMKLEIVGQGGRKKDFWDLHELLKKLSLNQMINFYLERYPYNYSKKHLLKKIVDFKNAEDDFRPNCYLNKSWELIKLDFEELVKNKTE